MTTSALNFTETLPRATRAVKTTRRPPMLPFSRLLGLLQQSMNMMQAIPDNGRISPRQLAKVRAMANSI
ncbi:hypothetical protein KTQ42_22105 [Noviherbaspirillum sp. L7-7A]|uniref:hypothetical protein n=1 Tax=Noviherbaspirillum sp. L7-7A TaxID=2850560 RepID=UPI001C2C48ED|nr:hypothetical protein [Noviherbaspirillum sp. L7-7A]MBV0881975.1 hypothetical protein [Noviherbaspirillum sp. L7-7A]